MTTMGTSRLAGALAPEFRDPLLAALLSEAPAATVVVDEGGHIVHANQAFLELHHLSSKDMGRHLRDASIDLWIQLEPVLDRVRDGFSVELNRVTLGHDCAPSRRYWEERWRPVHDDEGRVIATLGVAVDVTAFRNERDEWELSEAGEQWAEAMPFSRNGHSGYQILWNPAVAEQLKEVA